MVMDRSFKTITEYVSWIFKQYREIKQSLDQAFPLKIIDSSYSEKEKDLIFTVQVQGKGLFAKFKANYLANDKIAREKFSPHDQALIEASMKNKPLPQENKKDIYVGEKSKLQGKIFDRENKRQLFMITESKNGIEFVRQMYAEEISKDKNKLHTFDKDDIYEIAHTEGVESILLEKNELEKIHNGLQ